MKKKRKNNSNVKTILGIIVAILIISAVGYFMYALLQVEEIKFTGNKKFNNSYLEGLADVEEKTHMFFADTDAIKENLEKEPYIEILEIGKQYPNTIKVTVKEREPKALVKYADSYLLIDGEANMLAILPTLPEESYPVSEGFNINAVTLGKPLATEDTFKVSVLTDIVEELYNKEITDRVVNIDLADINSIKMKTNEGLNIKFGQSDKISDKIKWIKKMIVQLAKEGKKGGSLDVSSGSMATYKPPEGVGSNTEEPNPTGQDPALDDITNNTQESGEEPTGSSKPKEDEVSQNGENNENTEDNQE